MSSDTRPGFLNGGEVSPAGGSEAASTELSLVAWFLGRKRSVLFWVFQTVFWLTVGALSLGLIRSFQPMNHELAFVSMRVVIGFATTALLHHCFQHSLFLRQGKPARILLVVLAGIIIILIDSLALSLVAQNLEIFRDIRGFIYQRSLFFARFIVFGVWISLYALLNLLQDYYASEMRATRAESESRTNELKHLQSQLNPHFLFNALNAVVANKENPDTVEIVTQNLSSYLRFSLRESRPLEQFARELDMIQHYLVVQKSRFGENLQCHIHCDIAARAVRVPPMMLQPLLENAIHYGSMTCDGQIRVNVQARVDGGFLKLSVSNNGLWVPPDIDRSPGIAHRNLRQRLALLLGDEARLDVKAEGGTVCVTLLIPVRAADNGRTPDNSRRVGRSKSTFQEVPCSQPC